jgi:hypothetical protein
MKTEKKQKINDKEKLKANLTYKNFAFTLCLPYPRKQILPIRCKTSAHSVDNSPSKNCSIHNFISKEEKIFGLEHLFLHYFMEN